MAILVLLLLMGGDNQPDALSKKMLPIYLKEAEE
jgi:hypothetical protein